MIRDICVLDFYEFAYVFPTTDRKCQWMLSSRRAGSSLGQLVVYYLFSSTYCLLNRGTFFFHPVSICDGSSFSSFSRHQIDRDRSHPKIPSPIQLPDPFGTLRDFPWNSRGLLGCKYVIIPGRR